MGPTIAIVGGGNAGLAAANALAHFGFEAQVFEQAPSLGEIGAGIHVSPQAYKALTGAGIDSATLIAAGTMSKGIFTRDMYSGEDIDYADVRESSKKYGAPNLAFHRADLIDVLALGLDKSHVHLDHRLIELEEAGTAVQLKFANGKSYTADLLIAADGVRSTVRRALYGEDNPTFTGQMAWRSLLKGSDVAQEILAPSGHVRWVGAGRQFYAYYLRRGEIVAIVTQQESDRWVEESWSLPGDPEEMRSSFPDPEPRLRALLDNITSCSKWGLHLRPPSEKWGRGRVQLIGDAAHSMLPNAGQGACQAFEDGYILARWLQAEKDIAVALDGFRCSRMPRVHAVQRRSALNASAKRLPTAEDRKAAFREAGIAAASAMDWIMSYDPQVEWKSAGRLPATSGGPS